MLYHKHACEALGDVLLDLCDYAMRQLNRLIITTHARNSLSRGDVAGARRMEANADPAAAAFEAALLLRSPAAAATAEAEDAPAAVPLRASEIAAAAIAAAAADPATAARQQMLAWCRSTSFDVGCACVAILRLVW